MVALPAGPATARSPWPPTATATCSSSGNPSFSRLNVLALGPVSAAVRLVATNPGTFYGQRVTAGQVVVSAGRRHARAGHAHRGG